MKLMKTRNIVLSAAMAAVAVVPFSPAIAAEVVAPVMSPVATDTAYKVDGSHVVVAPCHGAGTTTGARLTVAYGGSAKAPGAVATIIGCGVVQNGSVAAYSRNALPGPAAATASTANLDVAAFSMCADVTAVFLDGAIVSQNNC